MNNTPQKVKVRFISDQTTIYFEKGKVYEAYRPFDDRTGKWWAISITDDDDPGDYAFPAEWFEIV